MKYIATICVRINAESSEDALKQAEQIVNERIGDGSFVHELDLVQGITTQKIDLHDLRTRNKTT